MALRTYVSVLVEAADGWGVAILRDPATLPVDVTAANPATISARVPIPYTRGQGFNGPNADGGHTPGAITAATNATPIVLTTTPTTASMGIAAGDYVYVTGVLGNLNANGAFEVTSVGANTITLKGSAGSAAYTSGGYVRKLNKATTWAVALNAIKVAIANDKSANN
jgi:hypothetical protein